MKVEWNKHYRPRQIGMVFGYWSKGDMYIIILLWNRSINIEFNNND